MAEAHHARERRVKRMRRVARILALIWAGSWSFLTVLVVFLSLRSEGFDGMMLWLISALMILIPWASTAVAWRWEATGGVLLGVEGASTVIIVPVGLILFTWYGMADLVVTDLMLAVMFMTVVMLGLGIVIGTLMALPPLAAGALFLASWRISRTTTPPQATE